MLTLDKIKKIHVSRMLCHYIPHLSGFPFPKAFEGKIYTAKVYRMLRKRGNSLHHQMHFVPSFILQQGKGIMCGWRRLWAQKNGQFYFFFGVVTQENAYIYKLRDPFYDCYIPYKSYKEMRFDVQSPSFSSSSVEKQLTSVKIHWRNLHGARCHYTSKKGSN